MYGDSDDLAEQCSVLTLCLGCPLPLAIHCLPSLHRGHVGGLISRPVLSSDRLLGVVAPLVLQRLEVHLLGAKHGWLGRIQSCDTLVKASGVDPRPLHQFLGAWHHPQGSFAFGVLWVL